MAAPGSDRVEDLPADPRDNWAALDQAARDAAYNNNAAVADSAKWIGLRNSASADYRAAHPRFLNLAYAPSERTAFDLYPAAYPGAPCLVFIHGGYWQRNSRELFACLAEGPAAAGWSVAIPDYTLAPQATMRSIVRKSDRRWTGWRIAVRSTASPGRWSLPDGRRTPSSRRFIFRTRASWPDSPYR